ncbi:uncharacterized protein LOC116115890 [Pistacia vera]|uniref:uncharacterized protein LOC116115890 n=1 Tax=Pistacia vera TaxID=55513 RepID=UPI00126301C1|nr:uncharacterized protein LOC116115890 [Pistacia vera]
MTGSLARGAPTFNSMFFKPMLRKSYHKTGTSADTIRESAVKLNPEEGLSAKSQSLQNGNCWVPHEKTGIYYPKGHEKVLEDVPPEAARDIIGVNWFSDH